MADSETSSNTAIVAIVVIVILVLGLLYFTGVFGPRETTSTGQTNVNIENPTQSTERSSTIERSTERSSPNRSSTTQTQERTTRSS